MTFHDLRKRKEQNHYAVSSRQKFAAQVDADRLAAVRSLAQSGGRQLQALIDEALSDLLEKHRQTKPRPHVMSAYLESVRAYDSLYKKLAE